MTSRYWIGVAHRASVDGSVERCVFAFPDARTGTAEAISAGDRVVYYAPKEDFGGEPVQAFVALGTITGGEAAQVDLPNDGGGLLTVPCDWQEVREVPVRPMIPDLAFIENEQVWGSYLQGGPVEIGAEDFQRIAGAMLGGRDG